MINLLNQRPQKRQTLPRNLRKPKYHDGKKTDIEQAVQPIFGPACWRILEDEHIEDHTEYAPHNRNN